MKILVTGSAGFAGKNLVENLKCIRDGKNLTRNIKIQEIFEYDLNSTEEELDAYCKNADFVFNLAGVNRPENAEDFKKVNFGFADKLLELLKKHGNKAPVMLSSSIQASLAGRFGDSEYGRSKREGEELFFKYGKENGVKVLVYRFPNLAGKWVRPNYNSAVGTFCFNIANNLPVTVNDPNIELTLLFIDDLTDELFNALEGKETRCEFEGVNAVINKEGKYCTAPVTHKATLGYIVECLHKFRDQRENLVMPEIPSGSFEKKLFSMYLSYIPKEKAVFPLKTAADYRGSFTEILKTEKCGQVSVNISKPGIVKGQHWHNSKWEMFLVVSGRGLIRQRQIGGEETLEFEVSGEKHEVVYMLPGYTHSITNLSDTQDLVTVMWANEIFDAKNPDTFSEKV